MNGVIEPRPPMGPSGDAGTKETRPDSAAGGSGKVVTIGESTGRSSTCGVKIYDLQKADRYTDVTLIFDDDRRLSFHRCVLAGASPYFDRLFSNGMKESRQDEIRLGDVDSTLLAVAAEFAYTGTCTLSQNDDDDFFELLLLANFYEFKELEHALVSRVDEACRNALEGQPEAVDFLVYTLIFAHRYPVVADTLVLESSGTSIRNYLETNQMLVEELMTGCGYISDLDLQTLVNFLEECEFGPLSSFKVASAWLKRSNRFEDSRLEDILSQLKLYKIPIPAIHELWGAPFRQRITKLRESQIVQEFLIIPHHGGATWETAGFVCHNITTGRNYYLDLPSARNGGGDENLNFNGAPKLCVTLGLEGAAQDDQNLPFANSHYYNRSLHCVVRGGGGGVDCGGGGDASTFHRFLYTFSKNQWVQPTTEKNVFGASTTNNRKSREEVPLDFLAPSHSNHFNFPIVSVGYEFGEDDDHDLKAQSSEASTKTNKPAAALVAEIVTTVPHTHLASTVIPGFEVTGLALHPTSPSFSPSAPPSASPSARPQPHGNIVVFGNLMEEGNSRRKESLVFVDGKKREGFPDGVSESALSTVPIPMNGDLGFRGVYVLPSAPFTQEDDHGNVNFKSPRLWLFLPHNIKCWWPVPTPSCPDLDYCSIYYDGNWESIGLILVQRPPADQRSTKIGETMFAEKRKKAFRGRGPINAATSCLKRPGSSSNRLPKRVVGRFILKKEYPSSIRSSTNNRIKDFWRPLPVNAGMADFLALGSELPGEVRITSAFLNVNNLREISLVRTPIGSEGGGGNGGGGGGPDFNVRVADVREVIPPWAKTVPMTPWLEHQRSDYKDVTSSDVEQWINSQAETDKKILFDSLKKRQSPHAAFL